MGKDKTLSDRKWIIFNVGVDIHTHKTDGLPNGGWSCMHYPLSELIPEMAFDYKPLKGLLNVPDSRMPDSETIFLPGEEISGEFLGEMKCIQTGVEEALSYYRSLSAS